MDYRRIMFEIYRVNLKEKRKGYSSESNYQYVKNKGIEPYKKYAIDNTHDFMAHPSKNSVDISIYYRNKEINVDDYMTRNKKELYKC